jgi:hypothetical protein
VPVAESIHLYTLCKSLNQSIAIALCGLSHQHEWIVALKGETTETVDCVVVEDNDVTNNDDAQQCELIN